jgi:hypothetical protein
MVRSFIIYNYLVLHVTKKLQLNQLYQVDGKPMMFHSLLKELKCQHGVTKLRVMQR